MGAGHASTSIGYAVGLKEAMRKGIGEDGHVVAVIGDGALTGGVAYEALHNAGGLETPIVIVLNDNGMSISPNVGALSRNFNRVRLNPRLYRAREDVEETLRKLPLGLGSTDRPTRAGAEVGGEGLPGARGFSSRSSTSPTSASSTATTSARCATRSRVRCRPNRPVVVHIHTVKGKGFAAAEEGGLEGMEKWHAAKPGSIVDRKPAPKKKPEAGQGDRRPGLDRTREAREAAAARRRRSTPLSSPRR